MVSPLLAGATTPVPELQESDLRNFGNAATLRKSVFDKSLSAIQNLKPLTTPTHTLQLTNAEYSDPEEYDLKKQKEAILRGETLGRRIKGTWRLLDNQTGKVLDERTQTIARIPFFSSRGTAIHRGNEYIVSNQARLNPGVYTRIKENGELESHINILPETGRAHRYHLDPDKSTFHINLSQSKIPLISALKAFDIPDDAIREAWGDEIFEANKKITDIPKLYKRLVPESKQSKEATPKEQAEAIRNEFMRMEVDPEVTKRTLGQPFTNVTPELILATTKKLLGVSQGTADVDDRDHLAFQTIMSPDDLFSERIAKDYGNLQKQLLYKAARAGNLGPVTPGVLNKQIDSVLLSSGLGQSLEEVNTAELLDKFYKITRMGEGGLPSTDAIPNEARSVQPSHLGFMDPLRTPESLKVGVDTFLTGGVRKGPDGKLYAKFIDMRNGGKIAWKSPNDVADGVIAFPQELQNSKTGKDIRVIDKGKMRFADLSEVDYVLPHMEEAMSPLGNLVPLKSAMKGQRAVMASRMTTQAVSLINPQAPLVQGGIPDKDGKSYEEEYGSAMGAVRSSKAGRVIGVTDDEIKIKHEDGTTSNYPLYNNFAFNRKTFIHNTPTVQRGAWVEPDQLLAYSNFTDQNGVTALGTNARVAYIPFRGANFEDAIGVSESMSQRFTSEQAYQQGLDFSDKVRTGKKSFLNLFPGKWTPEQLKVMDDDGVIKVGTTVNYEDPLVLSASQKEFSANKIHKKNQPAFTDSSVIWKHHEPGVVTDVIKTKSGISVLTKSKTPLKIGDKISGRYGDKGVVAQIIPDAEMPQDENGQPFEILVNSLGVISRANPAQIMENVLGKIAAKTGKPYKIKDFEDIKDLREFVEQEAKKHGIKDLETILDPETDTKIPDVHTGNRFFFKLHHMAECYDDQTEVLTSDGWKFWSDVVPEDRLATVENNRLLFEKPISLFREDYNGPMMKFSGRYVDYCVTPNHRMFIQSYNWQKEWGFREASDIHKSRFKVKQAGFDVAGMRGPDTVTIAGQEINSEDYAELIGWWVSEGCSYPHKGTSVIYQSSTANPEHLRRIQSLCSRLPWNFGDYKSEGVVGGVIIYSKDLATYLHQFGARCELKKLPRLVFELSYRAKLRTFEAMLWGDGNDQHLPTGRKLRYSSTSKQLSDDFQELAIHVGHGGTVRPDAPKSQDHYLPSYTVGVTLNRRYAQVDGDRNKSGFSTVNYDGEIFCAEMRTGLLLVRRNGKPLLSGNSKGQSRGDGSYSSDETPVKGGEHGSKRVSMLNVNALLSHGAVNVLRDATSIRGQKEDNYRQAFLQGYTPPKPKVPMVYEKFIADLKSAGINIVPDGGSRLQIMAMTEKDVDEMAGNREIKSGETVNLDDALRPVKGGLFDEAATGGHNSNTWSFIRLPAPYLNPVMEEPTRKILGLTQKRLEDVIAGREKLNEKTGPEAIQQALADLDLDREIRRAQSAIEGSRKTARDEAIKKIGYLTSAKRLGIHPKDWVTSKVPVLPTKFRPISVMSDSKVPLVADANYLYKELITAKDVHNQLKEQVGDAGDERLAIYNAFKAVVGLTDPIHPKLAEKNVKGVLKHIFGSSPKFGTVQRKLIGSTVDNVGRAVIIPDADMDMDSIGLPEEKAWKVFAPAVRRLMRKDGLSLSDAAKQTKEQTALAKKYLNDALNKSTVIVDRAPVLHRFGIMAFRPRLVTGDSLKFSPLVVSGFGADFDGDAVQYHMPLDDQAQKEALERMLPSRNLISPNDFKTPVHMPSKEFAGGLYFATSQKPSKKKIKVFDTIDDARKAFQRGQVPLDATIRIVNM